MPTRIREARLEDAKAVAEIHVRAWQAAYRGQLSDAYLDGLRVDDRIEMHRLALEAPPPEYRMWVAEEGGEVVGFAVTGRSEDADADDRTAELYAIYLDPDRVGTGLGRMLLSHAIADLQARRFRAVTLWVLETNTSARRFYETAGWIHDGAVTSERVDCEMRTTIRYRVDL